MSAELSRVRDASERQAMLWGIGDVLDHPVQAQRAIVAAGGDGYRAGVI